MKKVVIVEPEEPLRRSMALAVDWPDMDCVLVGEAADGEEGLDIIRREKPDLIITDIKMPRLNGIEMLRRLRAEGNCAAVILLTDCADFSYAQAAVRLGAADYLRKPLQNGELEEAVERLTLRAGKKPDGEEISAEGKSKYVAEVLRYVAAHYAETDMSISQVAASLGISEGHLSHVFKRETGQTLGSYMTDYRIRKAKELMRDCRSKVYEVAARVGYRDITYFSATFKKVVGVSPSEFQKRSQ